MLRRPDFDYLADDWKLHRRLGLRNRLERDSLSCRTQESLCSFEGLTGDTGKGLKVRWESSPTHRRFEPTLNPRGLSAFSRFVGVKMLRLLNEFRFASNRMNPYLFFCAARAVGQFIFFVATL